MDVPQARRVPAKRLNSEIFPELHDPHTDDDVFESTADVEKHDASTIPAMFGYLRKAVLWMDSCAKRSDDVSSDFVMKLQAYKEAKFLKVNSQVEIVSNDLEEQKNLKVHLAETHR